MRKIVKLGIVLLIITSIAALVLGLSNSLTSTKIAEVEAQLSKEARLEVLSIADSFKEKEGVEYTEQLLEVYEGFKGEETVGYAIKTAIPGYSGNVEIITGISSEGKITGVKVVKHAETPGLGANAEKDYFRDQYKEKSATNELYVVKSAPNGDAEILSLTGATITSKAVTKAVNLALDTFEELQE